jgi:hypothetical protein
MANPFSPLLNLFSGGGPGWTMPSNQWKNPDTGTTWNIGQGGKATKQNPMNAYFSQMMDPRYRQAMQQQNLFSNLLNFGARMNAAGAQTTDPGAKQRGQSAAWAGLGQGLMSGNQDYRNQMMNAIKLKSMMDTNKLAREKAQLEIARMKQQNKFWYGGGTQAKAPPTVAPPTEDFGIATMPTKRDEALAAGAKLPTTETALGPYQGLLTQKEMAGFLPLGPVEGPKAIAKFLQDKNKPPFPGAIKKDGVWIMSPEYQTAKVAQARATIPTPEAGAATARAREEAIIGARRKGELEKDKVKASSALRSLEQKTGRITEVVDRAIGQAGQWQATGIPGAIFASMPTSEANKLLGTLDTVKANIGFDKLQQMREASKTGGALGAVSENENKLLQALEGSLNPDQGAAQLIENLNKIKEYYPLVLAERRQAYREEFGELPTRYKMELGTDGKWRRVEVE